MSLGFFVLQKNDGKHTFTESRYLIGEQKNGGKKRKVIGEVGAGRFSWQVSDPDALNGTGIFTDP